MKLQTVTHVKLKSKSFSSGDNIKGTSLLYNMIMWFIMLFWKHLVLFLIIIIVIIIAKIKTYLI